MFDKEAFISQLEITRVGQFVFVEGRENMQAMCAAADEWGRTNGVETIAETTNDGARCHVVRIKSGSPKRARVRREWHGLEVGETRFMRDAGDVKPASVRAYVSTYCAKVGQRISVKVVKDGYNFTRIE